MIIKRKTQIILALLVTCIFLFQNCQTFIIGTSQKIPVTSKPLNAKIIVNGFEQGYTPTFIKLKKKNKNNIIRIEKENYNPFEIQIIRKNAPVVSVMGNVIFGVLGYYMGAVMALPIYLFFAPESDKKIFHICTIGMAVASYAAAIQKDYESGANYSLSPIQLIVTLTKIEEKPQPDLILLDARQFRNIKWIRIRCADTGGEDS